MASAAVEKEVQNRGDEEQHPEETEDSAAPIAPKFDRRVVNEHGLWESRPRIGRRSGRAGAREAKTRVPLHDYFDASALSWLVSC